MASQQMITRRGAQIPPAIAERGFTCFSGFYRTCCDSRKRWSSNLRLPTARRRSYLHDGRIPDSGPPGWLGCHST